MGKMRKKRKKAQFEYLLRLRKDDPALFHKKLNERFKSWGLVGGWSFVSGVIHGVKQSHSVAFKKIDELERDLIAAKVDPSFINEIMFVAREEYNKAVAFAWDPRMHYLVKRYQ